MKCQLKPLLVGAFVVVSPRSTSVDLYCVIYSQAPKDRAISVSVNIYVVVLIVDVKLPISTLQF